MTFVFRSHNGHEPFPFVCGWCGDNYLSARDLVEHVQRERAGVPRIELVEATPAAFLDAIRQNEAAIDAAAGGMPAVHMLETLPDSALPLDVLGLEAS